MKKRLLASLLAVCLIVAMLPATAMAANFQDTLGHWAEDAIDRWSDAGVVGGVGDGKFDPNGYITRAQAAAVYARLLKLTDTADISNFIDVDANAWYADSIAKVVAAGIMNGTSATTMNPGAYLTRADMFTMFCRALGIEPQAVAYKNYSDAAKVPGYAKGYVNALLNLGFANGTSATTIDPQGNMTRAQIMALLDQSISDYITVNGTHRPSGDKLTLVVANDVTITGFGGTIVAAAEGGVLALPSCLHGGVSVIAVADYVTVVSAPHLTAITAANGSVGVTANGVQVAPYDTYIVPCTCGTGSVVTPPAPPVHSHSYTPVVTAPTCTEDGYTTYTCSCGDSYVADIVPALGHTNDKYVNNGDGTHDLVCSVCGTVAIDNEAHTYDPATGKCVCGAKEDCAHTEKVYTDNGDGTHTITCKDCSDFTPVTEEHTFVKGVCICGAEKLAKFKLTVSSNYDAATYGGTGTTTVGATVYADYSIEIDVPGTHVNSDDVTIYAMMQKVSGLGVNDKREHSIHVDTDLGKVVALGDWMPLIHQFTNATVNVDVEGNLFTYAFQGNPVPETIDSYASNFITATTDSAAASAAWQALTDDKNIASGTGADDSKVIIANGSYLLVDTEKLEFEGEDDLVLDNFNDLDALENAIRDSVKLTSGLADENKVVVFLAAGTELAVGSSYAKLLRDATITVTGVDVSATCLASKAATATPLASIRDAATTEMMVKNLVHLFDAIVGGMEGKTVDVVVRFSDPVPEKFAKFQLTVSSNYDASVYGGEGTTTVGATVYNDYSIEIDVPGTHVNSDDVTIYAMMQKVSGLGVNDKREHSIHVDTDLGKVVALGDWMPLIHQFTNATVNVDVEGNLFTYAFQGNPVPETIDSYASNFITATTDSAAASAAWQALTDDANIASGTGADDSKVIIANGSYLLVDTEKLEFEGEDDLVLDNFNDLDALENAIRDSVKLTSGLADENKVVVFLAAGTELAVGSSYAKLLRDATITVTGVDVSATCLASKAATATPLASIRDAATTEMMVKNLVHLFDAIVGGMEGKTVDVVVRFSDPVIPAPEKFAKFQLTVSSNYDASVYGGEGTTTVGATVYNDYSIEIDVPGTHVNSDDVTIYAMMNKVGGLGVTGKREHSVHVNTGLGKVVALGDWMPLIHQFTNATVNVDVEGNLFTYAFQGNPVPETIDSYASNFITATTDSAAASAAWQALTDDANIASGTGADDSKVIIANGSYLLVDTEKLEFEGEDDLVLDNFNDLDALENAIRDSVKLTSGLADEDKVVVFLAAGTELAVGSSYAKLLRDATITVTGIDVSATCLASKAATATPLASIRDAATTEMMVKNLVHLFDAIVGGMEGKTVDVVVRFSDPAPILPEPIVKEYAKFQLTVSSNYDAATYGGTGTTTVGATVYNDYSIEINVPGTHVNSDNVTIYAMMNKVGALGVTDMREHSVSVNTGLGKTVALADWMPLVLDFVSATVNVDVEGNSFVYSFVGSPVNVPATDPGYDSNFITATTDPYAARAAWQALTAEGNIATGTGADDSKIIIANGSYLLVDTEMLEFQGAGDLVLDNFNDLDALESAIRDSVKLTSGLADENKVVVFLAAGTELAVGSSYARLLKDVTITITGVDVSATCLASKAATETPLAAIRDAATTEVMVKNLVHLFDAIVGGMNGKVVNVSVDFAG